MLGMEKVISCLCAKTYVFSTIGFVCDLANNQLREINGANWCLLVSPSMFALPVRHVKHLSVALCMCACVCIIMCVCVHVW